MRADGPRLLVCLLATGVTSLSEAASPIPAAEIVQGLERAIFLNLGPSGKTVGQFIVFEKGLLHGPYRGMVDARQAVVGYFGGSRQRIQLMSTRVFVPWGPVFESTWLSNDKPSEQFAQFSWATNFDVPHVIARAQRLEGLARFPIVSYNIRRSSRSILRRFKIEPQSKIIFKVDSRLGAFGHYEDSALDPEFLFNKIWLRFNPETNLIESRDLAIGASFAPGGNLSATNNLPTRFVYQVVDDTVRALNQILQSGGRRRGLTDLGP